MEVLTQGAVFRSAVEIAAAQDGCLVLLDAFGHAVLEAVWMDEHPVAFDHRESSDELDALLSYFVKDELFGYAVGWWCQVRESCGLSFASVNWCGILVLLVGININHLEVCVLIELHLIDINQAIIFIVFLIRLKNDLSLEASLILHIFFRCVRQSRKLRNVGLFARIQVAPRMAKTKRVHEVIVVRDNVCLQELAMCVR